MKVFDPWLVFFKKEWKRYWAFLTGFTVTGILITKLTAGFSELNEQAIKYKKGSFITYNGALLTLSGLSYEFGFIV
ncbi:hypothetical protein N665_0216s0017 [Sinapis alba]|nr:hypothetical protein N665_0216s0017 [Sinapis alba]